MHAMCMTAWWISSHAYAATRHYKAIAQKVHYSHSHAQGQHRDKSPSDDICNRCWHIQISAACVAKGMAVVPCPIPGVVTAWGRLLASLPLKMNTVGMEGRGGVWDNNRRCLDGMSESFDSSYMQCNLRQSNKIYKYMNTDTSGIMSAGLSLVGVGVEGEGEWGLQQEEGKVGHDRMSGYFDSTYMQCDLRQSNKIYKYMSTDTSGSMLAGLPLVGVGVEGEGGLQLEEGKVVGRPLQVGVRQKGLN